MCGVVWCGAWWCKPTVDRDHGKDEPGCPLGQVLDEDECHEGADHDEVGLLQAQRALPVDADHSHHAKVPDDQCQRDVVHGDVVGLEHLPGLGTQGATRHTYSI